MKLTPQERAGQTVVITGGAGFIGSHLVDRFLREGFRVLCLDNLLTGAAKNLEHLAKNPQFIFQSCDVSKPFQLESKGIKIAAVLHFASPASPIDYLEKPLETLAVGSEGTRLTLELARHAGARFLLASTSEIYGDPLVHPQPESYWGNVHTIGPRSVYDEAKRFAEALTMAYHRVHRVDTKMVRIFNTYGPRMRLRDGRAIPAFVGQALAGEALTVFGDGKHTRSFCYVDDLVEGLWRLLWSEGHDPVNLGNPNEMTILELAQTIQQLIPGRGEIVFRPLPEDDPKQRKPDISRAKKLLEWEPKVSLKDGLALTLDYFRKVAPKAA